MQRLLGVYSDMSVHFTPEFEAHQSWETMSAVEGLATVELAFHTTNPRLIEREFIMLADVHERILRVLDECCGGALMRDPEWATLLSRATAKNMDLARRYSGDAGLDPSRPEEGGSI